jgi:ribosomal protein S26
MLDERIVGFTNLYSLVSLAKMIQGIRTACTVSCFLTLAMTGIVWKSAYCFTCGTHISEEVRVRSLDSRHLPVISLF